MEGGGEGGEVDGGERGGSWKEGERMRWLGKGNGEEEGWREGGGYISFCSTCAASGSARMCGWRYTRG